MSVFISFVKKKATYFENRKREKKKKEKKKTRFLFSSFFSSFCSWILIKQQRQNVK